MSAARSNRAEQSFRSAREARAETAIGTQCTAGGGERSATGAGAGAVARAGHPAQAPVVQVWRLDDVDVLTRIGADYVITPAGGIDERTLPRVTLPAEEVLALIRRPRAP